MAIGMDQSNKFDGFSVDIKIDRKKRDIQILDNGYGIPKKEFRTKMTIIGSSEKSKFKDQIGFRGIGRLSAMPLCKHLSFTNKPKGLNELQRFTWDGDKFHELLNQGEETDFRDTIEKITDISDEKYLGDVDDHFFKVEIQGYKEGISELVVSNDLIDRLSKMLPLKYSTQFKYQRQIKAKYEDYMGESLDKFSFIVKLDGQILYKPYSNKDTLESGIVFWELKNPSKKKGIPGEKIGILWFSFNRLITARKEDEPHGILVRSKNMLMGNEYSLANAIIRSKSDYVTTPRELTQMLNGVTGEMLIHSTRLNDNARRDWFRIDEESIPLRHIIVVFNCRLKSER
jgi:molecular chaperone HtpG